MKFMMAALLLSLSACANVGKHVSDSENTWVNIGEDSAKGLHYCTAKADGKVKPVCVPAEIKQ